MTDFRNMQDDLDDGDLLRRSGTEIVGITPAEIADDAGLPVISSGDGAPGTTPGKVGNIYVDTTGLTLYIAVGTSDSGDWELVANDGTHAGIEVGVAAPATTPSKVGDIFVDTNADVAYIAVGTASSADWASTAPATVTVPRYAEVTFPDTFTSTAGANGIASAWRVPTNGLTKALVKAEIWVDTAPTAASITVDLHRNGTTVFTGGTQRPVIATSSTSDVSGTPSVTTMNDGDLFQFQVDSLNASDQGNCGRLFCRIYWTEQVAL